MESQLPLTPTHKTPAAGTATCRRPTPWLRVLKQAQGSELLAVLVLGSSSDLGLPGSPLTAGQLTHEKCTSSSST